MCKGREISAYLTGEARGFGNMRCRPWCILYNVRQEKGDGGGLKLRCDSDANDDEEEQQEEAISYTNTPSFAAREHASSLT